MELSDISDPQNYHPGVLPNGSIGSIHTHNCNSLCMYVSYYVISSMLAYYCLSFIYVGCLHLCILYYLWVLMICCNATIFNYTHIHPMYMSIIYLLYYVLHLWSDLIILIVNLIIKCNSLCLVNCFGTFCCLFIVNYLYMVPRSHQPLAEGVASFVK
jgi:hypothetical protein